MKDREVISGGDEEREAEASTWHALKWARLHHRVSPFVDHVEATNVYNEFASEPDRIPKFLSWLEERADPGVVELIHARAAEAGRTGPPPPTTQRRLHVVAADDDPPT